MEQMSLFDAPSLNVTHRLKAAMREAAKASGMSRDQLADRLTAVMKTEGLRLPGNAASVSRALLDKWLADGARHMVPVGLLPAYCRVTGSSLPLEVLARALDLAVIGLDRTLVLKWADAELAKREATRRARKLAEEIGL